MIIFLPSTPLAGCSSITRQGNPVPQKPCGKARKRDGIFTLVKNAHDVHTETSVSLIFNNIIQLERIFDGDSVKRLVKIVRASRYIEPEVSEFKITSNGIDLDPNLDSFIKEELRR